MLNHAGGEQETIPKTVAETLETVGMMELLKVYPTVEEAIASFRFVISNKRMERRMRVIHPPFKFSPGLSTAKSHLVNRSHTDGDCQVATIQDVTLREGQ